MFVKICGIKSLYDLENSINLGFDAFGIVLTRKSKRFVDFDLAKKLVSYSKGKIKSVAVAYNFNEIKEIYEHFDYIQLYNYVDKENLIFSSGNMEEFNMSCKYFLYDKSHGKGKFEKLPDNLMQINRKLIIAGGLNPENVKNVVKKFKPFGVDVSSGVERQGLKEYELMKKFIEGAKYGK